MISIGLGVPDKWLTGDVIDVVCSGFFDFQIFQGKLFNNEINLFHRTDLNIIRSSADDVMHKERCLGEVPSAYSKRV